MSPVSVVCLLLLALIIDYMSVGPDSIRDRIAFLLALPAIRGGFNGSAFDRWTTGALSSLIHDGLMHAQTSGTHVTAAMGGILLSVFVGCVFLYCVGCLLPMGGTRVLGRFTAMQFPMSPQRRLNAPLWACAIILGLMSDLPQGALGALLSSCVNGLTYLVGFVPGLVFGVS